MTLEQSPRTDGAPAIDESPAPDFPTGATPGDQPERDYRTFLADSPDVTLVRTLDGVLRYVSPASSRLFGWSPAELEGRLEVDLVHPDDIPAMEAARAGLTGQDAVGSQVTAVYRFVDQQGAYRWCETTSRLVPSGESWLVVSAMRDITERRRQTAALEQQALTDPLTGVANRNVLMDRLRQGLRRLTRGGGVLAVLYLDLDRFKIINDSVGHRVGDLVLLGMAERLTDHLRPADTLARLGGDEFVIVAEGMASEEDAVRLGERMVEAGRRPMRVGDEDFVCTLSIGVACTADPARPPEELVREADLALYQAKERGRDRAEVFDDDLRTRAVRRQLAGRMLRRALDSHEVLVDYQPIVDLHTGRPVGVEASAQLGGGPLQLTGVLGIGEEMAVLVRIEEQVLSEVVRQVAAWRALGPAAGFGQVAISITGRHLADVGFAADVLDRLDQAGVPSASLRIQITERVLTEASHSALAGVRTLREAGVRVGLRDFGSGYSSLGHLRQFPLDFVVIDRSFVADLDRGGLERQLVGAIVDLGHALGGIVVADGVESDIQLRALESLGCDQGQGPLFAHRLGPRAVADLLAPTLDVDGSRHPG